LGCLFSLSCHLYLFVYDSCAKMQRVPSGRDLAVQVLACCFLPCHQAESRL
jgi:hypothetical protein